MFFKQSPSHSPLELKLPISNFFNHVPAIFYRCRNDDNWTMEYISNNCEKITGYQVDDLLLNKTLSYAELIHPEDKKYVKEEVEKAVESNSHYHLEYRIYNAQGEIRWCWEEGKAVYTETGELGYLDGLIIDITERKKVEQEKYLLLNISHAISSAKDFETALLDTVKQFCNMTDWAFGEAWIPDKSKNYLTYCTAWFAPSKNYLNNYSISLAQFKEYSYQFKFKHDIGLPGTVWATKKSFWLSDVSKEDMFLRNQLALKCGLKAGFGVPIIADDKVVAVLVFFLRKSLSQDDKLLNFVEAIANQLGTVFKHKQIELALQESQRQLKSLVDSTSGAFFRISYEESWAKDYISDTCLSLTGYTAKELLNNGTLNLASITHPLDLEKLLSTIEVGISQHRSYTVEYRIFTANNQEKWLWEKGQGVYDHNGKLLGVEGFITDVSDRKEIESALVEANNKYKNIFENAVEGFFQTTANGYYINANKALAKIYGYKNPQNLIDNINCVRTKLYVDVGRRQTFIDLLNKQEIVTNFESRIYRQDGTIIWISENVRAVKDLQGNIIYYEGTVEDITKYKQAQEKLTRQTFYDNLTNLPNRTLFLQKLGDTIQKVKQAQLSNINGENNSVNFTLFFLDCDRFKAVNDTLGHDIGDLLLKEVAQRLSNSVREDDLVARLGLDEFTILCQGLSDVKEVIKLAEKIYQAFQDNFQIEQHQLFCSVSMGILLSNSLSGKEIQELTPAQALQFADTALHKSRSKNKGFYQLFHAQMHKQALHELDTEMKLRQSLQEEDFIIYYQPIIDLNAEKIYGFESLIRWQHPEKGILTPFHFLHIAEQTSLIIPLGFWILENCCYQLAQWHEYLQQNYPNNSFLPTLSINLSCQEFDSENFLVYLDAILAKTKVNPQYIKLEITESCCMLKNNSDLSILSAIKERNIQLWIDDFGTGYSSLSYLHKLPIDGLKLDRSFICDIDTNPVKLKVVKSIFSLAQDLGLSVVAEGIENKIHLEQLKEIGCNLGQGYYFAKPLNQQDANQFLLEQISDRSKGQS